MNQTTKEEIKNLVKAVIIKKVNEYAAETDYKPFFTALFDKKTIDIGSIVQSLYTTFGMSVYEQIAVILAKSAGYDACRQYTLKGEIDAKTDSIILKYWENLKTGIKNKSGIQSNKNLEIQLIKKHIKKGKLKIDGDSTVDVFIKKPSGEEFYIDISTVKNNLKGFEGLKLKMLRWIALRASTDKNIIANTYIAIPYNPYYPKDYLQSRWNSSIIDRTGDILIQDDFWNFVGGSPTTYNELLAIFKEIGTEITPIINQLLSK